jgi:hypothetical protein
MKHIHIFLSALALGATTTPAMAESITLMDAQTDQVAAERITLTDTQMDQVAAGSNANFPPGQFPSGNPAHAPGKSNPNEVPATNPSND